MDDVEAPVASLEEPTEGLFEKAKAYLMSANRDGSSVYDQLVQLMELLLDENPDGFAYDPAKFDNLFSILQKYSFVQGESTATCNEASAVPPQELQRLAENQSLFERPPPDIQTTIEQPDPYTTITTTTTKPLTAPPYESVAEHNRFWVAAGYGLAEAEAFLLDRSITKLSMNKNLQDVRFFGKIFGTQADYYIVSSRRYVEEGEIVYQEVNTMPKPPRKKVEVEIQAEPGFVGSNRLTFWVASHASAEWVALPDVTPAQINAARSIKRLFTGNLAAEVISSSPVPLSEAVYLRAQLTRIASGACVAPVGALEEPEEDVDEEEDEEEEMEEGEVAKRKEAKYRPLTSRIREFGEEEMDVAQFVSLDQWVHAEAYIYRNGRQTKIPEKPEAEEEEEEEEAEAPPDPEDEELEEVEEEEEEEEEEERELFAPLREDFLYAVVDIPQPPPMDEEDEEQEEEEPEKEEEVVEDNNPLKPLREEDIADDDTTKLKVPAWTVRLVNNVNKSHQVAVVQSLRWPGAMAFVGDSGRCWGCAYFGMGLKKTDFGFTPPPAPPILSECRDITEVMDPTAATEKLVRRGEEPPQPDSEDELEEAEEEEEM